LYGTNGEIDMTDVYICDGIRTPVGRYGGGLAPVRTDDLAAITIMALMERNPDVDWAALDDVWLRKCRPARSTAFAGPV
jgi:acetyl-CoA acetyltransferase